MEIAVFSDIHGNYEAFKQCVDLVLGRGIRTFIFLGDYLGEFPYPQKTMGLLYALKEAYTCFFVKGNKEDYWIDRKYNPACEWKDGDLTVGAMEYCYAHQTDRDISFFQICRGPSITAARRYGTPARWACPSAAAEKPNS